MERGGSPPAEVYRNFAAYAGSLPVVAFNFEYDWNDVLLPERQRLGIPQIGVPGFCALKLAQRLLDPVSAGNCKLQTLRQYYRLPENGAQTALADVLTVIDLMQQVLRPLAERRGLDTWEKIVGFTGDEWFSGIRGWSITIDSSRPPAAASRIWSWITGSRSRRFHSLQTLRGVAAVLSGARPAAALDSIPQGGHTRPRVWISAPSLKSCVESRGRHEL